MKFEWKNVRKSILIAAAILVLAISAVVAQQQGAATDTGIFDNQPSNGVSGEPDGAVVSPNGAQQAPAGTDLGIYDTGRGIRRTDQPRTTIPRREPPPRARAFRPPR